MLFCLTVQSKRVAMVTDRVKECNELISDMGLVAADLTCVVCSTLASNE